MEDIEALIIPPSLTSEKVTPVALGSIPKPKAVSRFEDRPEALASVTATVNVELLKPLRVNEPFPVRLPAALEYDQLKAKGLLLLEVITVALPIVENSANSAETAATQ
ncbi:hypothetical protein NTGHW29_810023 [Candidatus Nitrotoga sp. HW29]|nr:hypothetical protein NTGHW29_810023 [Candidatus Nitrotoga sp. HW29]